MSGLKPPQSEIDPPKHQKHQSLGERERVKREREKQAGGQERDTDRQAGRQTGRQTVS